MSPAGQIEIFMDWLSQPSRAVAIFCAINKIPIDISIVKVLKQEMRSQEYRKLNPSMKIPTIRDGDFILFESHAILRYLSSREGVSEFWYPTDSKARALVDQYLDWHHTHTRHSGTFIYHSSILPLIGTESKMDTQYLKRQVLFAFSVIEKAYLGQKPFLASTQNPTIADISCYCELMQAHMIKFDFSAYPNIVAWMKRMREIFPELEEGHKPMHKFIAKQLQKPKL